MELLSDYDCTINCHPGKANGVADALSRRNQGLTLKAASAGYVVSIWVRPVLVQRIHTAQSNDPKVQQIGAALADNKQPYSYENGELRRGGRLFKYGWIKTGDYGRGT